MTRPITLRQYYSAFKSLSGLFAGLTSLSPLLSMGLPERSSVYVFPPLGSADAPARVGAFALALAVTYLAFVWKSVRAGNNRNRITFFILITVVSLFLYLTLYLGFVRRIDIPSKGTSISRSEER